MGHELGDAGDSRQRGRRAWAAMRLGQIQERLDGLDQVRLAVALRLALARHQALEVFAVAIRCRVTQKQPFIREVLVELQQSDRAP